MEIKEQDGWVNKRKGKVYLTGGGCGDPGLLTLKAAEVLRRCDTVVYDSLVAEELLRWTKPDCEKIYVGKRYGSHARKQSEINSLLAEKALEGKLVVRLKGGDPYVFGRGGEEFLALQEAGISCEEIPGISSAIAVPAAAGIPVTHRGLSGAVTVVTGTAAEQDGEGSEQQAKRRGQVQKQKQGQQKTSLRLDFDALARLAGTLVILMGMHHLKEITEGLLAAGKNPDTPCAIIMEGTTDRQKCLRAALGRLYADAKEQGFTSPAVIVVGAVADLRLTDQEATWEADPEAIRKAVQATDQEETQEAAQEIAQETVSLAGVTVGVTGTPHFAKKLAAALEREGAEVKDMSFMEARRTKDPLPELRTFRWLVFTSPNGVRIFLDKMRQERRDLRSLSDQKIAVIGPGTAAALEESGMYADYMPQVYDAEHLAEGLTERIQTEELAERLTDDILSEDLVKRLPERTAEADLAESAQVIFLRARQGSERLSCIFTEKGISFVDCPLYELDVCEEKRLAVMAKQPDYIVFGSALGVRAYFAGLEGSRSEVKNKSTAEISAADPDFVGVDSLERVYADHLENVRSGDNAGSKYEKKAYEQTCAHFSYALLAPDFSCEFVSEKAWRCKYVCIGEKCREELRRHTTASCLVAAESGIEALVECIRRDVGGMNAVAELIEKSGGGEGTCIDSED